MIELYADGGVILQNHSAIGGTWAFRILEDGQVVHEESGVMQPQAFGLAEITNNQSELYALLLGFDRLDRLIGNQWLHPTDWRAHVYSDSAVSLGRVFSGYKWSNIPPVMHTMFRALARKLDLPRHVSHTLLDGHPTREQLAAQKGKRGHPVSEHNAWCDKACQAAAAAYLRQAEAIVCAQTVGAV